MRIVLLCAPVSLCEACSKEIAHHFTQAGLDDLAIEWWGKAGDQALRRSAFQEAIAHLGKAIEMADKAAAWDRSRPRTSGCPICTPPTATRSIAARGHGAPETTRPSPRPANRLPAAEGRAWTLGGRLRLMGRQLHARRAVGDEGARGGFPRATSRRDPIRPRPVSRTAWPGSRTGSPESIAEARDHLERALALFQPGRDDDLAFRFGQDAGVAAMLLPRAHVVAAGRTSSARFPSSTTRDGADRERRAYRHARTMGNAYAAMFELMRGDLARAALNAVRTRPTRA